MIEVATNDVGLAVVLLVTAICAAFLLGWILCSGVNDEDRWMPLDDREKKRLASALEAELRRIEVGSISREPTLFWNDYTFNKDAVVEACAVIAEETQAPFTAYAIRSRMKGIT